VVQSGSGDVTFRGCRVVTTAMTARLLLANQLRSLPEVDWTVVSGDDYEDPPSNVRVEVIPFHREFAPSDLRAALGLWRFLRRERFDFVQTHTPKASFLALPVARLVGTPALYTMHGSLYFRGNGRRANLLAWLFERWCCSWADLVLLQSREDERVLPSARICPRRKIRYIGNGIVVERFLQDDGAPSASAVPTVLMVSRLVREKGCRDYFAVARALAGRASFVHVGPAEDDQRDAISEREVAEASCCVRFVGPVTDVRPQLRGADVVVLPSYREGIPRVPMEAAVSGKPVVAYDVRGVRELVDAATGVLVPRGDVVALTRAVEGLVSDPELRVRLGEEARRRAVRSCSEDAVLGRLRDVYRSLQARETSP